ncbi:hypothetical protein L1887_37946 [Cichorium endivia]|nr:hypothetical protein L1887_37946 [Cichorium endivia]
MLYYFNWKLSSELSPKDIDMTENDGAVAIKKVPLQTLHINGLKGIAIRFYHYRFALSTAPSIIVSVGTTVFDELPKRIFMSWKKGYVNKKKSTYERAICLWKCPTLMEATKARGIIFSS